MNVMRLSMTYRDNGESAYHAIRKRFELLPDVQLHFSEMVCNRCQRDSCEFSVAFTSEARDPIGDGVHNDGYCGDSVPPNLVFIQNIFRAQLEELVVAEEEQEQNGEKELAHGPLVSDAKRRH